MLLQDWDDMAQHGKKGDWYFRSDESYITIRYGDDVFDVVTIPINTGVKKPANWLWDGNKESPTICLS